MLLEVSRRMLYLDVSSQKLISSDYLMRAAEQIGQPPYKSF